MSKANIKRNLSNNILHAICLLVFAGLLAGYALAGASAGLAVGVNLAVILLIWFLALSIVPVREEEIDKPGLRVGIILFWVVVLLGVAAYGFMQSA